MTPEQEAAADEDAGRLQVPVEWLAEMRNNKFADAFDCMGVERVLDFVVGGLYKLMNPVDVA
jgi:hypothetical protein